MRDIPEILAPDYNFPWEGQAMMLGRPPAEILAELDTFAAEAKALRAHPLGYLRNHQNAGHNAYQLSVSPTALENSFAMSYFNHLGELFLHKVTGEPLARLKRRALFRQNQGHYDGYDLWVNFAEEGDSNPRHSHAGLISAVIYLENDGQPTHFENGVSHVGERGDVLLFSASLEHWVDVKVTPKTRVTMSFNLFDPQRL